MENQKPRMTVRSWERFFNTFVITNSLSLNERKSIHNSPLRNDLTAGLQKQLKKNRESCSG